MASLDVARDDTEGDLARAFLTKLETLIPRFLTNIVAALQAEWNIDVYNLTADHVCWRTATLKDYRDLVEDLSRDRDHFTLLIESEVGGRPIATFRLNTPMKSLATPHQVDAIEIPSPKDGSPYPEGFEHVEFVIGNTAKCQSPWNDDHHQRVFEEFRQKYPDAKWNEKAMQKEINPDISIKLQDVSEFGVCSAKFHLMPLADVIAAEIQASVTQKST